MRAKSYAVFDIEVYRNYFLSAFKNLRTGRVLTYELFADGSGNFDADEIRFLMKNRVTIGFNSRGFDLPILYMALDGAPIALLKEAANAIIDDGLKPWEIERRYGVLVPKRIEHIDLIEVAPGQASLKIYGGRLHAPRMQDLPIKPDARLTDRECRIICRYCINDLDNTELLFNDLKSEVELRITMGEEYGQDLRSKSDAQIAETVIKSRMAEILGDVPKRPEIAAGRVYRYRVPSYIKFEHPALKAVLEDVREAEFVVAPSGKVLMPDALAKAKIKIGGGVYRMGIGGLHSSEKRRAHFADDDTLLIDRDVASYYPAIILTLGLFPKHLGKPFLKVYRRIVETRLAAKAAAKAAKVAGDKIAEKFHTTAADSLKITINGSFGKFGSKWSALYSPDLLIQVTVTGQLALLMLIDRLEAEGIPIVSANTDGIVIKCPKRKQNVMGEIVAQWEADTSFETEATNYVALYSRDVNNYIAVKADGYKGKGAYAGAGLRKNPANEICVDAAVARIMRGTPVDETIRACRDIRKFVSIRTVTGGALWQGKPLGKAIRWYYASDLDTTISYAKNGNKVPRSEGARPIMDLPDELPTDINYRWYIKEAKSILEEIGYTAGCGDDVEDLI